MMVLLIAIAVVSLISFLCDYLARLTQSRSGSTSETAKAETRIGRLR